MNRLNLINPYIIDNFWCKLSEIRDHSKTLAEQFDEFCAEHSSEIEPINEMIERGEYEKLEEEWGEGRFLNDGEILTEARLGKKISGNKPKSAEDGFATEPTVTRDDIEREQTSKNVTRISKPRPPVQNVDSTGHVKVVRNVGSDAKSMNDIHYCCRAIYRSLLAKKLNYEVETPFTLLDTEAVEEMDAVFAFMDVPNIDLSTWDTSNVTNMEGMFYKSTFNNDSIKDWNVSRVKNMKNMFVGSDMTTEEWIQQWYPNTINHALPKLGVNTKEDLDTDSVIDKIFGDTEHLSKNIRARKVMQYSERKHYVMSSSEFINESLKDTFSKVGAKIRDIALKTKTGLTLLFNRMGEMFNAITPENIREIFSKNKPSGVTLGTHYEGEEGVYGEVKKGSEEYDNFIKFMDMAASGKVNEARVSLTANRMRANDAAAPNINVDDWNTRELTHYIKKQIALTQKNPGREKRTLVVWGAPGIGKSSIPKAVIAELNAEGSGSEAEKMTVIVADCSMMTSDGFALPMPAKQADVDQLVKSSEAARKIAKENGISEEELKSIPYMVSSDAPKTWLPVYKPTGDRKKDEILNALVNGATQPHYDKDGYVDYFEKTGAGGILLVDEFLRANPNVFFVVCQLMMNYTYGEYKLGDKWQIIAASNRPSDDKEIRQKFSAAAAAGFNRMAHCNFVPDFKDWSKWALNHGFDETTLEFIASKPFDGVDSRWHNFDPELKNTQNNVLFASPRSWSDAINDLQEECEYEGYKHFTEMPKKTFRRIVGTHLPEQLAQEYTDYYYEMSDISNIYTYNNVIADPNLRIEGNAKVTCNQVVDGFVSAIRTKYSPTNRIPVEEFKNCMIFLCNNFEGSSNVIYTNFYDKVFDICQLSATEEIEEEYNEVGEIFAAKFPEFVAELGS